MSDPQFGEVKLAPKHMVFMDLSNYVHTCFWPAFDAYLADKQKYPYQRVLFTNLEGKLGTIQQDLENAGITNYSFIFVEDRVSKRKYAAFPGYKGGRGKDDDPEKSAGRVWLKSEGMAGAKKWLRERGYTAFAYSDDNEADDTIAALVQMVKSKAPVVIASSDKDLWQLYDPGTVMIYHMSKGCFVDLDEIEDKFGVRDPWHIPLVKALWGDPSDSIPNAVPRMQKQLLPYIKASDGKLTDLYAKLQFAQLTPRCRELLSTGEGQVSINYALAKLDTECAITWERA